MFRRPTISAFLNLIAALDSFGCAGLSHYLPLTGVPEKYVSIILSLYPSNRIRFLAYGDI